MAELNKEHVTEVIKPTSSDDDMVYVTIPVEDLYDQPHPGVRLNRIKFEAGKTYRVRADVATEVEDRLERFRKEQVRLLRPKTDQKAINQVNAGSEWSQSGYRVRSLEGGLESLGSASEKVITVNF